MPSTNDLRFSACLTRLIGTEGGYVDHPNDRGGATNFGISLRFLTGEVHANPRLGTALGFAPGHVPTALDIRALTPHGAAIIYRACFWDRNRCGDLPAPLDGAVFDQCVNGGGAKTLQRMLFGYRDAGAIAADGVIGDATIAAVRTLAAKYGVSNLVRAYRAEAQARYQAIVARDPSQHVFLKGWLDRAAKLGSV